MARLTHLLDMVYYILRAILYLFWPRSSFYKDVSSEIVLITGGGLGLGRLLASKFAALGATVIIWDINEDNMKETEELINSGHQLDTNVDGSEVSNDIKSGKCHSFRCDVSKPEDVYQCADKVRSKVGHPSLVIMNAGIVNGKKLLDLSDQDIQRVFSVNTLSHFWIIKAFLPNMMEENRGHIVSIDSVSAYYGTYNLIDYSASKAASTRIQDGLASELYYGGYDGIRITSVLPYFMNTGMFAGSKSRWFGILEPEYVAEETVSAILSNRSVVFIPKIFNTLRWLTYLVPYKSFFSFHKYFFGGEMMSDFTGRNANKEILENGSCTSSSNDNNNCSQLPPDVTIPATCKPANSELPSPNHLFQRKGVESLS